MKCKEAAKPRHLVRVAAIWVGLIHFLWHPSGAGAFSPTIHGSVTNETAFQISEPNEFTKIKNILRLSTTQPITSNVTLNLAGRFYHDAVFGLTDTYGDRVEEDQESEADLREAFFHLSHGDWDLRLGKQQIVWGEAVGGLFVADVVTPKDLREFILPEPSEMRIPVWAANMEYFLRGTYLQFVWIPLLDFNELPVEGSEFEQPLNLPQGVPATIRSPEEPSRNLKNSGLGIRISRMISGWDLGAFYLYTYDYFPAPFRRIESPVDFMPTVILEPEHRRLQIFGATFSKALGENIIRGEFALSKGKYFASDDPADRNGVAKKDFLDYLLSADHTFWGRVDCNIQWLQRIIFDHDPSITDRRIQSSVSLWLQTSF